MLALGARAMERALAANRTITAKDREDELDRISFHWTVAVELSNTCHRYYRKKEGPPGFNDNFAE